MVKQKVIGVMTVQPLQMETLFMMIVMYVFVEVLIMLILLLLPPVIWRKPTMIKMNVVCVMEMV